MASSITIPKPAQVVNMVLKNAKPSVAHLVTRQHARRYFQGMCEEYLAHHFSSPWGEHHYDLMDCIQNPEKDKRIVRCEPRDHGKSTMVLVGAPTWWLAGKRKDYVCLFGASGGAVGRHYETLQAELNPITGNQRLLRDFPHLMPLMDFKKQFVAWNETTSVVSSGAMVEALSSHGNVRGMKKGSQRPDVMMFDDPQDDETVATEYMRNKFLHRFRTTLMNLIAKGGDIYVIGNLLHNESLVGTLLRDQSWNGKLYRAENVQIEERDKIWPIGNTKTDGTALWENGRWPLIALHRRRDEIKSRAYSIEYMNRMASDEEQIYDSTLFMKFHVDDFELDDSYHVFAFWDPSDPQENSLVSSDYACITVMAAKDVRLHPQDDPITFYWVLHSWLKQARVELQCEEALRCLVKYPIRKLFYEDIGGFGTLMPYLRRLAKERDIYLPIKRIKHQPNKIQKIYNSEATIKKRVFFADHLDTVYFTQWDEFPRAGHDDGPDSTVSGIEAYRKYFRGGFTI